jgi:hypothetical protein
VVGRQVHDAGRLGGEARALGGERLPHAVGQRHHQRVEHALPGQRLELGRVAHHRQRAGTRVEPGQHFARGTSRLLAARQHRQREAGVCRRQARELLARVAAGAQHGDARVVALAVR